MDANVVMAKPSTTRCSGIGPSSRCSFSVRLPETLTCRGHLPRHPPVPDRLHHVLLSGLMLIAHWSACVR
ncbi:hypothetical protein DAI22_01g179800 [Oryza sativa Japonica Group]|nr:hypothetical protein DAI22_01g179800 [Oryza sativa Japonica Group]